MAEKKDFLFLANINNFGYRTVLKLFSETKCWLGHSIHSGDIEFQVPKNYPLKGQGYRIAEKGERFLRVTSIRWLTSIDCGKRPSPISLTESYSPERNPTFDNFPAICVDSCKSIPKDYFGLIGVPLTFLDKWNPNQFEILDCLKRYAVLDSQGTNEGVRQRKSYSTDINRQSQVRSPHHQEKKLALPNKRKHPLFLSERQRRTGDVSSFKEQGKAQPLKLHQKKEDTEKESNRTKPLDILTNL